MRTPALRGSERILVAAEAVVQHGCRVLRQCDHPPFAPGRCVLHARPDQPQRLTAIATPSGEDHRRVRETSRAGGLGDPIGLVDERRGGGELACVDVDPRAVVQRDGQEGQRGDVACKPEPRRGEVMPRPVIPEVRRDPARQQPVAVVLIAVIFAEEGVDRSPERPDSGYIILAEACGQTIE